MTVPDYPPGEWSAPLVGAQWVSITSVTALNNAIGNRGTIQTNFTQLHGTLQNAITTTLAGQEGVTADAIRDAFRQGAEQAAQIAEKNGTYKKALQDSLDSVQHLREKLTAIAKDGNEQINKILQSNDELDVKVTEIGLVVTEHQRQANQAAGDCAFGVIAAGQKVVDAQGTGRSFFGMARDAGIDVNHQPNQKAIEDQVRGMLNQPPGAPAPGAAPTGPAGAGSAAGRTANAVPAAESSGPAGAGTTAGRTANAVPAAASSGPAGAGTTAGRTANAVPGAVPAAPGGFGGSGGSVGGLPMAPPPISTAPMTGMPGGFAGTNPPNVAPGLNNALPTSAPMSPGAPGLPAGPVQPMEPQVPPTAPTIPAAATGTPVTVGDAPPTQQVPAPPAPPSSTGYSSEPVSPMMSGAAATPLAASGPLPAYGSDLRPPVAVSSLAPPVAASVPSAPVSPPLSSVSGSAPVHPSAGGAPGVGQPAVVRQPTVPTPAQAPPGVGTEGAIATAGGALAGAASAEATARARLQRLLAAVARQQPRLAWAVGDRSDDSTVLVTDLASGWIPPGIEIPSAVTLLEPARRRGDLETLLGEVKLTAATEPGHYRPDPDADEPVPTSPRRRHAPEVEELSWRLSDATRWRDGLPRLAHTLARAASRHTGVLESEAEQLHDELIKLADRVLDSYPDDVDADDVGNWQLLAAIEALVVSDKTAANYHLAWFLVCNTTTAKSVAR
jgi:Family of unknown function (DUF5632)/Family of unknown function (DUF5631)